MTDLRGKQIREGYRFLLSLSATSSSNSSIGAELKPKIVSDGNGVRTALRVGTQSIESSSYAITGVTNASLAGNSSSIKFTFDTNDFIDYNRTTNELRFVINNSQRLFLSNTGKVGINTDTPLYTLSVDGGTGTTDGIATDGLYHLRMKDNLSLTSGYAAIHYKNADNYYLMVTDEDDADGTYNAKRPLTVSLASANVFFAGGRVSITHDTGDINTSGDLSVTNGAPTIRLKDTATGANWFSLRGSPNVFYVLTDRNRDGAHESPHPLELYNMTETGFIYGKQIITDDILNSISLNAQTLDNIDSLQFLRSDVADSKTAGHLTFNDNVQARFGNDGDLLIFHSVSNDGNDSNDYNYIASYNPSGLIIYSSGHMYIDTNNKNGTNIYFRDASSAYATRLTFSMLSAKFTFSNEVGTEGEPNKIKLYSGATNLNSYGFGISNSRLNYSTTAGGSHSFYSNGALLGEINSAGMVAPVFRNSVDGNNYLTQGSIQLRNVAPIIYLRDTDGKSTALHCTNDTFYVGRTTANDSTTIAAWPLTLSLVDGDLNIEGQITGATFKQRNDNISRWEPNAFVLRGTSPTIYFRDRTLDPATNLPNQAAGMIHVNSNYMHFLRGDPDTEGWTLAPGKTGWPLALNLTNHDAIFGGNVFINQDSLSFGSRTGSSPTDLSKHIRLYGESYGFSITGSRLNYIVPEGARHDFYLGAAIDARIEPAGTALDSSFSVVTREKGDARYAFKSDISSIYVSPETAIANGGGYVFAHGRGGLPDIVVVDFRCIVPDGDYAVGDIITIAPNPDPDGSNEGFGIIKTATEVRIRIANNGPGAIVAKNSGGMVIMVASRWLMTVRAIKF
jgi:hypothetical protein